MFSYLYSATARHPFLSVQIEIIFLSPQTISRYLKLRRSGRVSRAHVGCIQLSRNVGLSTDESPTLNCAATSGSESWRLWTHRSPTLKPDSGTTGVPGIGSIDESILSCGDLVKSTAIFYKTMNGEPTAKWPAFDLDSRVDTHPQIATVIVCLLNLFPWWNNSHALPHQPIAGVGQRPRIS